MAKSQNFRTDSVLGNLPPERQEALAQFIAEVKEGDRYEEARLHLVQDGIKVSRTAVHDWFQAWRLRRRFSSAESFSLEVQDALKGLNLGLTMDQLESAGQLTFTKKALEMDDAEEFRQMQLLALAKKSAATKADFEQQKIAIRKEAQAIAEQRLKLEREKYELQTAEKMLDDALRRKAQEIATSPLSNAEKIAAMRKAAFSEVDALEASGAVEIPK